MEADKSCWAEPQSEDESDESDVVEHDVSTFPFIILVYFSSKIKLDGDENGRSKM